MRLFTAINLPAPAADNLQRALAGLATYDVPVRWLEHESLHITLNFLGEVGDARLPSVGDALYEAVAGTAAFDVALRGLGAFPTLARPTVFWCGVVPEPALLDAQRRIEAALADRGFPSEQRAFKPHVTLGRVRKDGRAISRAVVDRMVAGFDYKEEFRAESVDLMRSRLSPRGARYEVLEKVELV